LATVVSACWVILNSHGFDYCQACTFSEVFALFLFVFDGQIVAFGNLMVVDIANRAKAS